MARLIVEAKQTGLAFDTIVGVKEGLPKPKYALRAFELIVSVSFADTGLAVTKLGKNNFSLTNFSDADLFDLQITAVSERKWDPGDLLLSGIYSIEINGAVKYFDSLGELEQGLGLRVMISNAGGRIENAGQTVFVLKAPS